MKKRKDGRYAKKITLPDGNQKFVYGKSPAEVTQKERALLKEYESGVKLGDETIMGAWAEEWFQTYKSSLRAHTRQGYANAYNNHILPYLGEMRLRDIEHIHIQKVMNAAAGYSEDLQRKILNTMRQIFRQARYNHLMTGDPTEGIKITPHARDDRIKFLTNAQQTALMENVTEPRARAFCALCLYAGLRREEALGLQWNDINGDTLTVRRAVTFLKNQQDPNHELKSKAANRTVPIPDKLQSVLENTPRSGLYLITPARGGEMSLMAFRRLWNHVTNNVDFDLHPHMLRHTYATILYKAGIDLKTAQYLMGHSDIKMTANIYMHIENGVTASAANKLNNFLSGSQNGSQNSEKSIQTA